MTQREKEREKSISVNLHGKQYVRHQEHLQVWLGFLCKGKKASLLKLLFVSPSPFSNCSNMHLDKLAPSNYNIQAAVESC